MSKCLSKLKACQIRTSSRAHDLLEVQLLEQSVVAVELVLALSTLEIHNVPLVVDVVVEW
jgi:hypothetical protein